MRRWIGLVRAELAKLRRLVVFRAVAWSLLLGPGAVVLALRLVASDISTVVGSPGEVVLGSVVLLAAFGGIVLAASLLGSEFDQGTARMLLSRGAFQMRGVFSLLAPDTASLLRFGASGSIPVFLVGHWWTVLSASWLHGSALHILFNMMWVRQLGPATADAYGPGRMVIIYTVAGAAGFLLSSTAGFYLNWMPVPFLRGANLTVGASASIFGLLGAILATVVVFQFLTNGIFLTPGNLYDLGKQVAILGVAAAGVTCVLIMGEFDISTGGAVAFIAAVLGLIRIAVSDYLRLKSKVGLSHYNEAAMLDKLKRAGFSATRAARNIGHNQWRMTFLARPAKSGA